MDAALVLVEQSSLPAGAKAESVAFMKELVLDALTKHQSLTRTVATSILDAMENAVRLGFYLCDIKSLLPTGSFGKWVSDNLAISGPWASQLRRLSAHFARDLVDLQQRERLGIVIEGLDAAVGLHLRNQIRETGAGSVKELLRLTHVIPPQPYRLLHHRNGEGGLLSDKERKMLFSTLQSVQTSLNALDPGRLSLDERKELVAALRGLVTYYEAVRG
jgi:hypothetical protein